MEKIIPAISSGVRGPAGVAHLPRLWLTAIAAATGTLAESYAPANDFDRMLTDDLSIDPGALTTFLRTVPTYQATEAWVRAHAGAADDAAIARHNASVDAAASVLQNDLADWDRLHAFLASRNGTRVEPMVPLVSMHTVGPRGIKHLPRMWAKARLHRAGALPDSWRSGETRIVYTDGIPGTLATPGQGIDAIAAANLGIDLKAMIAHLQSANPSYPEFEAWIVAYASNLDAASIAHHNAGAGEAAGEKPAAELARMGYPEFSAYEMFTYNDLGDWDAAHAQIRAMR